MKVNRQILTARALQDIQTKTAAQRAVDPVDKTAKNLIWKQIFDAQLKGESDAKISLKDNRISFRDYEFSFYCIFINLFHLGG